MFAVNNIIFCDRNGSVIDELKKVFQSKTIKFKQNKHKYVTPSFNYESEDIRRIKLAKGLAFMSPANSFLQFDGGIDLYYGKMFPSLQKFSNKILKTMPKKANNQLNYIPVGSCIILPVENGLFIVAAPTMFTPSYVKGTRHAYWAMLATLYVIEKYNRENNEKITSLVIPGLCTGCGKISAKECAKQISDAFDSFKTGVDNFDEETQNCYLYYADKDETDTLDYSVKMGKSNSRFKKVNS
jgi:O-acetyl-ADP-ribose deacetylase (regulator of RNase III)